LRSLSEQPPEPQAVDYQSVAAPAFNVVVFGASAGGLAADGVIFRELPS